MTEFIWKHNNITYTITKSNKPEKKLMATYVNPDTKRLNTIHFGGAGFEHYFDRTGLLDKKLNHKDPERRKRYKERHRNDNLEQPSSGLLSWHLLW